jgi:hypothetical protein
MGEKKGYVNEGWTEYLCLDGAQMTGIWSPNSEKHFLLMHILINSIKTYCIALTWQKLHLNSNFLFIIWGGGHWGLNSGLHPCKAGTLALKPLCQPFLVLGILEMRSLKLFALAGLKSQSSWSLSTSLVARITDVSHQCPAVTSYF